MGDVVSPAIRGAQSVPQPKRKSSENLWDLALSELDQNERADIKFDSAEKLAVVTSLSRIVKEAEDRCVSKQWRYKRKSGETVILRDVFAKVAKWVDRFKTIGDAAVQYDPVHAALPWAGVRFLIEVAVGHIGQFDFLVEGAEMIAHRLDRCAIFEDIYLSSTSLTNVKLKESLTVLYVMILRYLVKAKQYFQQKTAVRMLKAALISRTDFEVLTTSINTAQSTVNGYAALVDAEISKDLSKSMAALTMEQASNSRSLRMILHEIDGPIQRISLAMQKLEDDSNVAQLNKILARISSEPYLAHHSQNYKGLIEGTGQWLLRKPTFTQWLADSASTLLWLHGSSGTGKTKLVSLVIQTFLDRSEFDHSIRPVYFYCSRDIQEPTRSSPRSVLASIVRQMSCVNSGSPILPPTSQGIQLEGGIGVDPRVLSVNKLTRFIIQLTAYYPVTIVILDALDECDNDDRYLLLDAIQDILNQSTGLVKILVSSREEGDLVYELQDYPSLRISSSDNSSDIEKFVQNEVEDLMNKGRLLRHSQAKDDMKKQIIHKLIEGANGMFRWVTLKLEALIRRRDEEILEQLGRLPQKLTDLYHDTYKGLLEGKSDIERSLIQNTLKWLLCAQASVTSSLFCVAITQNITSAWVTTTPSEVLDLCASFVVHDKDLDRFRFAHPSVQDFLLGRPEYAIECSHASVAECCLSSILKTAGGPSARQFLVDQGLYRPLKDKLPAIPVYVENFGGYTLRYGIVHCKKASTLRLRGLLQDLFQLFFLGTQGESSLLAIWRQWGPEFQFNVRLRVALFEATKMSSGSQETHRFFAFLISCAQDFPEIVSHCLQSMLPDDVKANGLLLATYYEQQGVLTLLNHPHQAFLTKNVIVAALRELNTPEWKRDTILLVFLRSNSVDVRLLSDVLKWGCGSRSRMALMFFCCREAIFANDDLLTIIAGQKVQAETLPHILRHGGRHAITERVVSAAIHSLNDILEEVPAITPGIISAAITNDTFNSTSMYIIESRTGPIQVSPNLYEAIAMCKEYVVRRELLLNRKTDITPELLKCIIKAPQELSSRNSETLLEQILEKCPDLEITQDIFDAAIDVSASNPALIRILLKQSNSAFEITEDIIGKAMASMGRGSLVPLLLSCGPSFYMTENTVRYAINGDFCDLRLLGILLRHTSSFKVSSSLLKSALFTTAVSIADHMSYTASTDERSPTPMPPQMKSLVDVQKLVVSRRYRRLHHILLDEDPSRFLTNLYMLFGHEKHTRITYDLLDKVPAQLRSLNKLHVLLGHDKDVRITYGILGKATRRHVLSHYAMNVLWKRMVHDGNAADVVLEALQHHLSGLNEHGSTAWASLLLWYKKGHDGGFGSQDALDFRTQLLVRMPHRQQVVEDFCEKLGAWMSDRQAPGEAVHQEHEYPK